MSRQILILALAALILAACGDAPPEPPEGGPTGSGQLPEDNVFRPYVDTMERARGVEQTLQQGAERQRRLLDAQGD
jgi:hypothetical protein